LVEGGKKMAGQDVGERLVGAVMEAQGSDIRLAGYTPPVARALGYLLGNFHQPIGLGAMAAQAGVSRSHLCRLFRREVGISPHQFLTRVRVERAKSLLAEREWRVTEVWLESGFADLRTFERAFKRWVGCTPREYRQKARRLAREQRAWEPKIPAAPEARK
jgi:AraC-like DNA-binding protein